MTALTLVTVRGDRSRTLQPLLRSLMTWFWEVHTDVNYSGLTHSYLGGARFSQTLLASQCFPAGLLR